jgi:protein phosphatase
MTSIVLKDIVTPWLSGKELTKDEIGQTLKIALQEAHFHIKKYNAEQGVDSGTTATVCCVIDNLLICANVGDSRTYLWRAVTEAAKEVHPTEINATAKTVKLKKIDKATLAIEQAQFKIERVSRDQSLVQDLYDQGIITLEQVYTDNRRNVVLSALGSPEEAVPVDIYERELRTGDRLLLVSDGLWEMVRDEVIAEQVATNPDLDTAAEKLIALANQNGGVDNISVVLVEVSYKE